MRPETERQLCDSVLFGLPNKCNSFEIKKIETIHIPMISKTLEKKDSNDKTWTENMEVPNKDGSIIGYYKGELKNGLFHGKGSINYTNASTYEGEFFCGQRQGTGIYNSKENGCVYTGKWNSGYFIKGEKISDNGYKIKGIFKDWSPIGKCVKIYSNGAKDILYYKKNGLIEIFRKNKRNSKSVLKHASD